MDAEDWLRTMERELHTAQCDDREKVLYGPRLLRGAAESWWESYLATHAHPDIKLITKKNAFFVTRAKDNMLFEVVSEAEVDKKIGRAHV